MKNIVFKKISIQNFLSVGDEPVIVDFKKGLHIITGLNRDKEDRRNGVGKSTVADAIYFAIFGTTLRELKKEHIVNNINRENCKVILDFSIESYNKKVDYQIIRMLEPSKCYIFKNDEDKTRDSIINTNDYILSKINCSPEIFQNCVIMTVNNTIPFMAKKKVEKRKFIEGIFNLEVFSNMLSVVREEYNSIKKNFDVESAKFTEVEKNLNSQKKAKELHQQEREAKHKKYADRKINNTNELKELNEKINKFEILDISKIENDIKLLNTKTEKIDKQIKEFREKITTAKTQIDIKEKDLKKIGTDKETCPTCLRPIKDHDRDHIKDEKTKIKSDIDKLNTAIKDNLQKEEDSSELENKVYAAIETLKNKINDHKIKLRDLDNIKNRIEQLNTWQTELEIDLNELKNAHDEHGTAITDTEKRLKEISDEIEKIKIHLNTLDAVKFVISEEGVKSYIVKKILQLFNSKLAYYLKKMDSNCICIFNEYFEEEIIDEKGKPCSYFNFSGAERKNIDLACLFAFMDIRRLQGDIAFNFSIYDELLDSSLDERGVELVIGILKERIEKYNECIMVISHRKESIKCATGDIIFLEKKNGFTKRVEFSEY
jgi:DNA repair exonuclease SbcCD ATPase subunit